MWDSVDSIVVGVVLAFVGAQIAKGGRRWRALVVAGHELDAAQKLGDDPQADRLRERARARLERYLSEDRLIDWELAILGVSLSVGGFLLVGIGATRGWPEWVNTAGSLIAGLGGGAILLALVDLILPKRLRVPARQWLLGNDPKP